jgi:hypothetical protein
METRIFCPTERVCGRFASDGDVFDMLQPRCRDGARKGDEGLVVAEDEVVVGVQYFDRLLVPT